jgi:cytochrome P450 family 135
MALPPGPRSPYVSALRMVRNPIDYLSGLQRRYGDVFSVPFPSLGRMVYFTHPDAVKEIFTGDPALFHSGEAVKPFLEPVVGPNSVFVRDEDDHLRERKLLLPPFHGERIRTYADTFADITAREVERWPPGRPFALRERMQRLTLEAILRTVFGIRDAAVIARFQEAVASASTLSGDLVVWMPALRRDGDRFGPWARFRRARARMHALVHAEIDRSAADPALDERDDVLALLLRARREDGSAMTRDELRDELMTVIAAGHETTATGLSWFFERVLRHPEVEERLRAEIDSGDGDEYLDATVREVLRVRPVILDVVRRVKRPTTIGGWELPADTDVVAGVALVQRRPEIYPEPLAFRPERWLDADRASTQYAWIPFGGGVRRCIGAAFAQLELKVMARTILEGARLSVPDPRDEPPRAAHVSSIPAGGARVVLQERLAADRRRAAVPTAARPRRRWCSRRWPPGAARSRTRVAPACRATRSPRVAASSSCRPASATPTSASRTRRRCATGCPSSSRAACSCGRSSAATSR